MVWYSSFYETVQERKVMKTKEWKFFQTIVKFFFCSFSIIMLKNDYFFLFLYSERERDSPSWPLSSIIIYNSHYKKMSLFIWKIVSANFVNIASLSDLPERSTFRNHLNNNKLLIHIISHNKGCVYCLEQFLPSNPLLFLKNVDACFL